MSTDERAEREQAVAAAMAEAAATFEAARQEWESQMVAKEAAHTAALESSVRNALDQQLVELTGSAEEQSTLRAKKEHQV